MVPVFTSVESHNLKVVYDEHQVSMKDGIRWVLV
jgi:hypothetical protein